MFGSVCAFKGMAAGLVNEQTIEEKEASRFSSAAAHLICNSDH